MKISKVIKYAVDNNLLWDIRIINYLRINSLKIETWSDVDLMKEQANSLLAARQKLWIDEYTWEIKQFSTKWGDKKFLSKEEDWTFQVKTYNEVKTTLLKPDITLENCEDKELMKSYLLYLVSLPNNKLEKELKKIPKKLKESITEWNSNNDIIQENLKASELWWNDIITKLREKIWTIGLNFLSKMLMASFQSNDADKINKAYEWVTEDGHNIKITKEIKEAAADVNVSTLSWVTNEAAKKDIKESKEIVFSDILDNNKPQITQMLRWLWENIPETFIAEKYEMLVKSLSESSSDIDNRASVQNTINELLALSWKEMDSGEIWSFGKGLHEMLKAEVKAKNERAKVKVSTKESEIAEERIVILGLNQTDPEVIKKLTDNTKKAEKVAAERTHLEEVDTNLRIADTASKTAIWIEATKAFDTQTDTPEIIQELKDKLGKDEVFIEKTKQIKAASKIKVDEIVVQSDKLINWTVDEIKEVVAKLEEQEEKLTHSANAASASATIEVSNFAQTAFDTWVISAEERDNIKDDAAKQISKFPDLAKWNWEHQAQLRQDMIDYRDTLKDSWSLTENEKVALNTINKYDLEDPVMPIKVDMSQPESVDELWNDIPEFKSDWEIEEWTTVSEWGKNYIYYWEKGETQSLIPEQANESWEYPSVLIWSDGKRITVNISSEEKNINTELRMSWWKYI